MDLACFKFPQQRLRLAAHVRLPPLQCQTLVHQRPDGTLSRKPMNTPGTEVVPFIPAHEGFQAIGAGGEAEHFFDFG